MGGDWYEVKLEQVADVIGGGTPSSKKEEYWGGNVAWISPKDLSNYDFRYISKGERNITELGLRKSSARLLPKDSVLFTSRAPIGYVAIAQNEISTNQGFKSIILNTDQFPLFYYYLLKYKVPEIESLATGSTFKEVSGKFMKNLDLKIPPFQEQKAIAHILGTLDDKIELNRKMNETLEEMAQALFKSWFVDFDPVLDKALAAGHEIPEPLQTKAEKRKALGDKRKPLPKEIADLFPDRFVFTEELGWIPEGWEVKSVSDAIQVNPRTSLSKGEIAKFADMKALPESGFAISGIINKEYKGGAKFVQGDVLLARITPCLENGKTGLVDFLNNGEVGFGSTEFIVLRSNGVLGTSFIACLSRSENFRNRCIQSMVGSSGRQRVQNAVFDSIYLAISNKPELYESFNQFLDPNFNTISSNNNEIEKLEKVRDTLLPKLISGELRVTDVEKMMGNNF